jgi:hypothetical protein
MALLRFACLQDLASYQRAKMLTHQALEMLKPRTGLTNAQ